MPQLTVIVNEELRDKVTAAAKQAGLSQSEFVRESLLEAAKQWPDLATECLEFVPAYPDDLDDQGVMIPLGNGEDSIRVSLEDADRVCRYRWHQTGHTVRRSFFVPGKRQPGKQSLGRYLLGVKDDVDVKLLGAWNDFRRCALAVRLCDAPRIGEVSDANL